MCRLVRATGRACRNGTAGAVAVQKASSRNQKYRYADFRAVHQYYLSQAKHDYNTEPDPGKATKFFHIENEYACFHTGLYNQRYKAIYAYFERNKKQGKRLLIGISRLLR